MRWAITRVLAAAVPAVAAANGATAAARGASSAHDCASAHVYNDTACSDHAYRSHHCVSSDDCCASCGADGKCGAWTFHSGFHSCSLATKPDTAGQLPGSRKACTCGSKTPLPPLPPPLPPLPPPTPPRPARSGAPNIVLILTDDQDHFHGSNDTSLNAMPRAHALLAQQGATFDNFYVNTPVCCPSRSELFSGRLNHNIRMPTPAGGCMHMNSNSVEWQTNTVATGLQAVGYRTALFGKYLNTHAWFCDAGVRVPPGWDRWFSSCNGVYYYNTWNDQGKMITNNSNLTGPMNADGTNYNTAIVANYTVDFIRNAPDDRPFFVFSAPHAPHVGEHGGGGAGVTTTPAKWYCGAADGANDAGCPLFEGLKAPRRPTYNYTSPDLHWLIAQQQPIMPGAEEDWIDEFMRNRWRSLLSVDDLIVGVVNALEETSTLNNTWIFFTSDHGQNLGHYRLPSCKLNVYEHDVRVPLLVRGPGLPPGRVIDALSGNTDLAPTILELAGGPAAINPIMDGKSLVPLLLPGLAAARQRQWQRTEFLIEYNSLGAVERGAPVDCGRGETCYHLVDSPHSNEYRALRVIDKAAGRNLLFAEFTNLSDWNFSATPLFEEYFDMTRDPWQLENIAGTAPQAEVAALRERLHTLWECKASTCP